MKKRTLVAAALTAAMTLGMSLTSFAAEEPTWIVPKNLSVRELNTTYGTTSWWAAEALMQARTWAENNKSDVVGIQDEKARYEAIVKKVCNFLTYDINYVQPHIAYTIRDGKGVCADYTALTFALCEKCGISAQVSLGAANEVEHDALWVTLNGKRYFSDPTNYDTGAVGIIMESTPAYYREMGVADGLLSVITSTGADVGENSDTVKNMEASKQGMSRVGVGGKDYYITIEDGDKLDSYAFENNIQGMYSILDKYNIPHA